MSADKAAWTPRLVVSRPAGERTGRVVAVQPGVVAVVSGRRRVRASLGAALLCEMAKHPGAAPRLGDRVQLRFWADGPTTVERVLVRAVPSREDPHDDLLG